LRARRAGVVFLAPGLAVGVSAAATIDGSPKTTLVLAAAALAVAALAGTRWLAWHAGATVFLATIAIASAVAQTHRDPNAPTGLLLASAALLFCAIGEPPALLLALPGAAALGPLLDQRGGWTAAGLALAAVAGAVLLV